MHMDLDPARGELAALLGSLPREPAPYGYAEFERRAALRGRAPARLAGGQWLAVACLIGVGVLAAFVRTGIFPGTPPSRSTAGLVRAAPGPDDESLPPHAALAERWLQILPSEPAVVHVETRAAVLGLEDRIAQIDDLLGLAGTPGDVAARRALQEERARLLGTLVQVRYAETLASGTP